MIAEDYDFTKLDKKSWPECDLWLQKLHLQSYAPNQQSISAYEGYQCFEKYMKTINGKNLHYQCLLYAIEHDVYSDPYLYRFDRYDD